MLSIIHRCKCWNFVGAPEMIIIGIYCLHSVVYDDSSGFVCISLIFSHAKEIGLLHYNFRLFILYSYSWMYLNFLVCFNSIMVYIRVFHSLTSTVSLSLCIVWFWAVLRLEFWFFFLFNFICYNRFQTCFNVLDECQKVLSQLCLNRPAIYLVQKLTFGTMSTIKNFFRKCTICPSKK